MLRGIDTYSRLYYTESHFERSDADNKEVGEMKPRWLLLAVSILCLLVLFPATVLSQQLRPELHATCGAATADGVMSRREWDHAGVVPMYPGFGGAEATSTRAGLDGSAWDVSLAQPDAVTAQLYAMYDEDHLYLAELMNLDSVVADPLNWMATDWLVFMDEPDALDGDWEAPDCGPPRPGEGDYAISEEWMSGVRTTSERFSPIADPNLHCHQISPIPGVDWAMGLGSLFVEWEVDLNASDLDKVGPDDCLLIFTMLDFTVCRQGADCGDYGNWVFGTSRWPQPAPGAPDVYGMLCLDPCEEEFVPEPGSMLLLGSGLAGLAGYATLRLRSGQAARRRDRD